MRTLVMFGCVIAAGAWSLTLRLSNIDVSDTRLLLSYPWQWAGIVGLCLVGVLVSRGGR